MCGGLIKISWWYKSLIEFKSDTSPIIFNNNNNRAIQAKVIISGKWFQTTMFN